MTEWRPAGVVVEGQPIAIEGRNVWDHRWARTGEVDLPHPSYPEQRHRMIIYEMEAEGRAVVFAAGELSPGVWGFFVPAQRPG